MAILNAASGSQADVQLAVNNAASGDTVVIPAGTFNWNAPVTLSKAVTIQGAGGFNLSNPKVPASGATQINSTKSIPDGLGDTEPPTALDTQIFKIAPTTDAPIRVTGIYFNMQNIPLYTHTGGYQGPDKSGIQVFGRSADDYGDNLTNAPVLTQIRIDNCYFSSGKMQVHVFGHVEGVIDHNTFINGDVGVGIWGYDSGVWVASNVGTPAVNTPGTIHAMFVEDNTFIVDNNVTWTSSNWAIDHQVYHQEGARSVIRYNNFDLSGFTKDSGYFVDVHGNQNYYAAGHWNFRGSPLVEIYKNTFKGNTYQLAELRGGSILFHDNTATGTGSFSIEMWEEEAWQKSFFSTLRTSSQWPAEDQINASFFWNNTLNGSPLNPISGNPRVGSSNESGLIKLGRDYWLSAPNSNTKTTYPSCPAPSSGYPNVYSPITSYTPFTYPHPMATVGPTPGPTPTPPNPALFAIGQKVTSTSAVIIRSTPGGPMLGLQTVNAIGTIVGGPTPATLNGNTAYWYQLTYPIGINGWCAEDWLTLYVFTYTQWEKTLDASIAKNKTPAELLTWINQFPPFAD